MEMNISGGAHTRLSPANLPCLSKRGVAALALIAAFGFSQAMAEPAPPYLALVRQTEGTAPRLAESDAYIRAAEGQAVQAAVRPNPVVGIESEDIGHRYAVNRPSQEQTTLSVSQPLEIGGQRSARIVAAGAGLDAARAQREQMRVEFAYDLALAYAAAELAGKRADLAAEALSRAQEDERAARALVNAGREADLRAVQANAATTAAQDRKSTRLNSSH